MLLECVQYLHEPTTAAHAAELVADFMDNRWDRRSTTYIHALGIGAALELGYISETVRSVYPVRPEPDVGPSVFPVHSGVPAVSGYRYFHRSRETRRIYLGSWIHVSEMRDERAEVVDRLRVLLNRSRAQVREHDKMCARIDAHRKVVGVVGV